MKRLLLALALTVAFAAPASAEFLQFAQTVPPGAVTSPGPIIGASPVGTPVIVAQPEVKNGGFINIGQSLGPALQPIVDDVVNSVILAIVGWLAYLMRTKLNVSIDEGHRDALVRALQNQAGSLIADGFVKVQNAKVEVPNEQLAEAANEVLAVIPDAAARLGLTPDYVAKRIVDMIPQTPAGAAMIAPAAPSVSSPPKVG